MTSSSLHDALLMNELAAYVRTRGFERPWMEQMISQYVRAHGRITRREAAELCRVSEHQAYYLLKKLVREGNLQLAGKGRGSYCIK